MQFALLDYFSCLDCFEQDIENLQISFLIHEMTIKIQTFSTDCGEAQMKKTYVKASCKPYHI